MGGDCTVLLLDRTFCAPILSPEGDAERLSVRLTRPFSLSLFGDNFRPRGQFERL